MSTYRFRGASTVNRTYDDTLDYKLLDDDE